MKTSVATMCACLFFGMSGCGITYTSPKVSDVSENVDVNVVSLTPQTVSQANQSSYNPRTLPAVFYQTAGAGGAVNGLGALPESPVYPNQRPVTVPLRIPPAVENSAYVLGVGDVVLLATRGASDTVEQLTGLLAAQNQRQGYTVRDDGAIAIPEIGAITVAGLTVEDAEDRVFERLVQNGIDPEFSLEIAEFNSKHVSIGGSVNTPRLVPITLNPLRLGSALTQAGGTNLEDQEYASIRIYRAGTLYQIPVAEFFAQPDLQNIVLTDQDSIYVDTSYDLSRAQSYYEQQINAIGLRQQARSNALNELQSEIGMRRAELQERRENFQSRVELGSDDRDYVYLAGEVSAQQRVALPYESQASLADILYDAGGFPTMTANPSKIYVLRATQGNPEQVTAWHLDAGNAVNLTLATRMEMRPDDIIFIQEQPITTWGRALQQLFPALLSAGASSI